MKRKLLFEEVMQFNKWVSGIASRDLASQKVTLRDLFNKTTDQNPNFAKADKVLPYPLPNVIEQIGQLYLYATNSKRLFKTALSNPVIKRNELAKEKVIDIYKKLDHIIQIIDSIAKNVETPVAKKQE